MSKVYKGPEIVRDPRCPELMGVWEVARALEVEPSNVASIRDLPDPVIHLKAGRFWMAEDIRDFAEVYNGRRGSRQLPRAAAV